MTRQPANFCRGREISLFFLTEPYTFDDADGGAEGAESEVDEDEEDEDVGEEEAEGEEEEEEAEGGMDETDDEDEDDTAERMDACGEAPRAGFVYSACPPLETEAEQRALCGRKILAAHILDRLVRRHSAVLRRRLVVEAAGGDAYRQVLQEGDGLATPRWPRRVQAGGRQLTVAGSGGWCYTQWRAERQCCPV